MNPLDKVLRSFKADISSIELPKRFTFPFFYEPHPLCVVASIELQQELLENKDMQSLFDTSSKTCLPYGKMFGVLIVQRKDNSVGYLTAYSGKLGHLGNIENFVPPVFDLWNKDGFFKAEESVLNQINKEIEELESNPEFLLLHEKLSSAIVTSEILIKEKKEQLKSRKATRKKQRETNNLSLDSESHKIFEEDLIKQSLRDKHELKVLINQWTDTIASINNSLDTLSNKLKEKKDLRKEKSNLLQTKLFQQYQFLNIRGEQKDLIEIFENTTEKNPPAATGDCAAPKLLQYAFLHKLKPLAMAEFWWGNAPKSEIRKHKNFYPACRGKCEPILGHMLEGMDIDENLLINPQEIIGELKIVYDDEDIIIVNKPSELLSVPGINIQDSVYTRIKALYPNATGPLIVHRLDMATSGLLILAKNKEAHKSLQKQFLKKIVKKRYVALLDKELSTKNGVINLPLRVDLEDRPRQLVCFEYGKNAETHWELIETINNKSKVYFYPITGRTHQLRVHSSHMSGLNAAIVGDDLYGKKENRLHLHAESIGFHHPRSYEWIQFNVKEEF